MVAVSIQLETIIGMTFMSLTFILIYYRLFHKVLIRIEENKAQYMEWAEKMISDQITRLDNGIMGLAEGMDEFSKHIDPLLSLAERVPSGAFSSAPNGAPSANPMQMGADMLGQMFGGV